MVGGNDRGRCACGGDLSGLEQDGAVAQALDRGQVVRDEKTGDAAVPELLDPLQALDLKFGVADGEHLVDEQDVGFEVRRDREPEPHGIPDERISPACR